MGSARSTQRKENDHDDNINQPNLPTDTLRDGALKATLWRNFGENGTFYSVEISRTYNRGEAYKDSHSFSGTEPLQVARLARLAYDRIAELREADKLEAASVDPSEAHREA